MISESVNAATEMKAPTEPKPIPTGNCPLMKPSLSMTSLPPDENSRNCGEVLKAKLRDERPYNSLKKKRISQRDSWRHSWGSGHSHHSHSSCSIYSNTTGTGLSSGKDDFWAALQTNYNYIMDTNLMDTCREARCELECETRTVVNTPECCSKMFQPNHTEGTPEDVKGLRRWLREKENTLAKAPTLFEATHLTTEQLRKLLADHSVLYYDIVSHARVVNACVRGCERSCTDDTLYSSLTSSTRQPKKSILSNGEYRASEDNLKGLERRYHLLYLKAIEVQCLFEGLLGKRNSSTGLNRTSSTETDDEPAFKVARYTDSETPKQRSNDDKIERSSDNRSNIARNERVSEGRSRIKHGDQKKTNRRYKHYSQLYKACREPNGVDFDADSEGSEFDNEILNTDRKRHTGVKDQLHQKKCAIQNKNNQLLLSNTMESNFLTERQTNLAASEEALKVTTTHITNSKEVALRSTANPAIANLCKASVAAIAVPAKKRHRIVDVSKFNRSNRKSKNCAIFYFKHLDTDNENFGLSSQGSEINKSADPSSDEGWLYSRDCVDGINEVNYDSDKENYREIANNSSDKLSLTGESKKSQALGRDDVIYSNKNARMEKVVSSEYDGTSIVSEELKDDGESVIRSATSITKLTAADANISGLNQCGESSGKTSPVSIVANQDSIRQLVLNADNLIREDLLKTPTKKHIVVKISSTVKKREIVMSGPNLQKVQEWLEHQPRKEDGTTVSQATTDCEASGEYTESDSSNGRDSDTSDGPSDSVATCMQTGGSNSQCTSTEKIGGSAEPIPNAGSNLSLGCGKVIRRTNKRNCDRPWSVSCLSQLTENDKINGDNVTANQGLATHSISESALHVLSVASTRNHSDSSPVIRTSGSKGSLRRRKPRKRKVNKRSDSGSDGLIQKLFEQQSISGNMNIIEDITEAFSMISLPKQVSGQEKSSLLESEEEELAKPNFKIGPVTNPSYSLINESKLGPLAALANYMNEEQAGNNTGTEDHSSFSEQAWDNFQEKYNSENYSEGMDSDAARRLLEFGDDYRNFLDSQSDCCSSLSAANNLDSLSPPRMDSLNTNENKLPHPPPVSTIDHIRRRRVLELEYERRREIKKKNSSDELRGLRSPTGSTLSINNISTNNGERMANRSFAEVVRRLDFQSSSPPHHLKKSSESESNCNRRRKSEESSTIRRRVSRASDKALRISSVVTSSSNTSSDEEKEVKSLLVQSRKRLEDTNALKIRSHLLRPEDYNEILTTCKDNIDCLGSVLHGASGTLLSTARSNETRDLLSSWEHLFAWSENAAAVRKMQEEMMILRNALGRFGKLSCDLDSEACIQLSIEELKGEKIQLQTFRTNMLRLNASVHSWLTREEMRTTCNQENIVNAVEEVCAEEKEYFINLRNDVSDMYCAWDEADVRVSSQLETLTNSLIAWRQLETGLSEFHQVLGEDRGALQGLEGVLDGGKTNAAELANNVKIVAKLLSEKVAPSRQQVAIIASELGDQGRQFHTIVTSSNGSLSDSGISDGGATSDGGLSERERRLVVLRRLAKQLENALAPGSEALRSIAARMESAESELKTLQNTCRDLIVRTSVSQQNVGCVEYESGSNSTMKYAQKVNMIVKKSPSSRRKSKRRTSNNNSTNVGRVGPKKLSATDNTKTTGSGDPDDPQDDPLEYTVSDDDIDKKRGWTWRIARIALPVQVAIITLLCAACLMEPHCCDTLNNFSMSFTPQLRYIRGPPPI